MRSKALNIISTFFNLKKEIKLMFDFFSSSETAGRFQNGDPKERTGADADAGKLSRFMAIIFFPQICNALA